MQILLDTQKMTMLVLKFFKEKKCLQTQFLAIQQRVSNWKNIASFY